MLESPAPGGVHLPWFVEDRWLCWILWYDRPCTDCLLQSCPATLFLIFLSPFSVFTLNLALQLRHPVLLWLPGAQHHHRGVFRSGLEQFASPWLPACRSILITAAFPCGISDVSSNYMLLQGVSFQPLNGKYTLKLHWLKFQYFTGLLESISYTSRQLFVQREDKFLCSMPDWAGTWARCMCAVVLSAFCSSLARRGMRWDGGQQGNAPWLSTMPSTCFSPCDHTMWPGCSAASTFVKPLFLCACCPLLLLIFTILPYLGCEFLAQKELCCNTATAMGFLSCVSGCCGRFMWQQKLLLPIIILPYLSQGEQEKHNFSMAILIIWKYVYSNIPCKFSKYTFIIVAAMTLLIANTNAVTVVFSTGKYYHNTLVVFYCLCTIFATQESDITLNNGSTPYPSYQT